TDTEAVIEAANIVGNKIEIHAHGSIGSFGNVDDEVQIDLKDGHKGVVLSDDERVALASAERQDIVYVGGYESAPGVIASAFMGSAVVNFSLLGATHGVITLTAGSFPDGMFKPGDLLYIAGNTQNT